MSNMEEQFYQLIGKTFRITGPKGQMYCDDRALSAFRTDSSCADHDIEIKIVDELSQPEGELIFTEPARRIYRNGETQIRYEGSVETSLDGAYLRIARQGDHSAVQVERKSILEGITTKIVLNSLEAEHHIAQNNGFLLHASYIRVKDQAILFTAPSGTGKSTQADLWCSLRDAELLNGDRAAVMAEPGGVVVRGVPFAGSSNVCKNVVLPLSGIVYLSQAPQTSIERLTGLRAFWYVWEGCSVNVWNRQDVDQCTQTVMDVVQRVPVFHLACTPDESAVIALERALNL